MLNNRFRARELHEIARFLDEAADMENEDAQTIRTLVDRWRRRAEMCRDMADEIDPTAGKIAKHQLRVETS